MLTWDTNTNYETLGDGMPLVFVHGATLDARLWTLQWKVFSRAARVIRYDLRGHGRSSSPKTPYGADAYTMQLRTLLDGLRIVRPVLIGHSIGAATALHFALRFPTRVSALVLANPEIWGAPIPDGSIYQGMSAPRYEPGPVEEPVEMRNALHKWLDSDLFAATRDNEKAFRSLESLVLGHGCAPWRADDPPPFPDDYGRLSEVEVPTLILYGEREDPYFQDAARAAGERIRGVRIVSLPGVGHVANLEAPVEFNRKVLDFLAEHDLARSLPPGAKIPPKPRRRRRKSQHKKSESKPSTPTPPDSRPQRDRGKPHDESKKKPRRRRRRRNDRSVRPGSAEEGKRPAASASAPPKKPPRKPVQKEEPSGWRKWLPFGRKKKKEGD